MVQNLLEEYFSEYGVELMRDSIDKRLEEAPDGSNYLFVGETLYMDSLSEERLFEFVEKGNKAFIFSKSIPFNISDVLFGEYCFVDEYNPDYDFFYDSILNEDILIIGYFRTVHGNDMYIFQEDVIRLIFFFRTRKD